MALQCSQLCLPTSLRCDLTPRKVPLFRRLQCANTLQNSNIAIQVRFSRHCKKDLTRNVRQWRRRNVCVRAVRKDPKPTYVEMIPIKGEDQFNEVLGSGSPVIIDWMATWCRKCIYLKPKLEKLAAEYHPEYGNSIPTVIAHFCSTSCVKFYCVDVNAVPSTLVSRAEVTGGKYCDVCWHKHEKGLEQQTSQTSYQPSLYKWTLMKMPTIQLWKNNEKKAEVIGGDQAWLVMDKIREMLVHKR